MSRVRLLALSILAALVGVTVVSAPAHAADATISGIVRDATGVPAAGLSIRVLGPDGSAPLDETVIASDGSYELSAPEGVPIRVYLDDYHFVVTSLQAAVTESFVLSGNRVENLTIPAPATVHVTVVNGAGGPPSAQTSVDATSSAFATTSGGLELESHLTAGCTTASDGTCDLRALRGGGVTEFEVKPAQGFTQTFDGMPTPDPVNVRTLMLVADYPVSGLITGADGSALAGAAVEATNGSTEVSTTTAADGSYTLRVIPGTVSLRVRGTTGAPWSAPYEFVTGSFTLDGPRTVSLSLPGVQTLQILVKDSIGGAVPAAQVTMTGNGSVVTGTTANGIPVTTYLNRAGGTQSLCVQTNALGICEFPVLQGGTSGAFTVAPPYGSTREFPESAATPGVPRQVVARLQGYATTPSAGSIGGSVLMTTSYYDDITALSAEPVSLPAGIESVVGKVGYRVRLNSAGNATAVALRLPAGAMPNALFRVGTDGKLTDITAGAYLSSGVISFGVGDGSTSDEDGSTDGFASGNLIPVIRDPLTVETAELPAVVKGRSYSTQLVGSGSGAPYTWDLAGGSLPPGISLSPGGLVSGTPTQLGSYNLLVRMRDSYGATVTRHLTLTVSTIAVVTTSVPDAYLGGSYSVALKYAGGSIPSWRLVEGSLPPGIKLSSGGTLSGTPTTPGTYRFRVVVASGSTVSPSQALVIVVHPMEIATASLPDAPIAAFYSQKLTANGGKGTLAWSITGGALPPGLTLTSPGTLSGKPTAVGSYQFTVSVTDQSSPKQVATRTFTVVVTPMQVATTSLPNAKKGQYYSAQLVASGGKPTLAWSVVGGSLPTGLSLSSSGKITGYPKALGSWTFTVKAADASAPKNEATATLTLTVV